MSKPIARPDWKIGLASNVRIKTLAFAGEIGTVTKDHKTFAEVSLVDKTTGKRFEVDFLKMDLECVDLGPADEPVFVGYVQL